MSRRRGEFEHRTSIFEGAFRAWSHLGGLDPEDLENTPAAELDPLTNPIGDDRRHGADRESNNPDGTKRRMYPYEPLPRSGLAHPYVQAILSPWLGPDADQDAIQLGLTTLRTWWQHRRKGESGSAIAALGTDKMRGVVEGYTRHFFNLAHCLVMNDKEQPPRTLHAKTKELEKTRNKRNKKKAREEQAGRLAKMAMDSSDQNPGVTGAATIGVAANTTATVLAEGVSGGTAAAVTDAADSQLSPLERLHAAQRRQLAENGGIHATIPGAPTDITSVPLIPIKGQCTGKVDLPSVVSAVNHHANQLAHRGGNARGPSAPAPVSSSPVQDYGDPNTTPVVFVSHNGDIQIAMSVDGITCAHCVKIVETVLKGCNGNKSPIDGLLDAAADRALCKVLIKLDKSSNAKRVAFEAARNLAMVGYTAKPMEMSIVNQGGDKKATMDLGKLSTAFEVIATTDPKDVFDWNIPCTCPDNGILREDCSRHSQMNRRIFEAFQTREQKVNEYMAGCGRKYGMSCTCGPDCRCANCSEHCRSTKTTTNTSGVATASAVGTVGTTTQTTLNDTNSMAAYQNDVFTVHEKPESMLGGRNSFISFGGNMRHMSITSTSEATFGRAMSGLSALSIDWENMEDFDVNVDHSAHINNTSPHQDIGGSSGGAGVGTGPTGTTAGQYGGVRRSSLRRSINTMNTDDSQTAQVSFKV